MAAALCEEHWKVGMVMIERMLSMSFGRIIWVLVAGTEVSLIPRPFRVVYFGSHHKTVTWGGINMWFPYRIPGKHQRSVPALHDFDILEMKSKFEFISGIKEISGKYTKGRGEKYQKGKRKVGVHLQEVIHSRLMPT